MSWRLYKKFMLLPILQQKHETGNCFFFVFFLSPSANNFSVLGGKENFYEASKISNALSHYTVVVQLFLLYLIFYC